MDSRAGRCSVGSVAILLGLPVSLAAQTATLSGTVTDPANAESVAAVNLELTSASGENVWSSRSDDAGHFRATGLIEGSYTLSAMLLGYAPTRLPIALSAGENRRIQVELGRQAINLRPLAVTATGTKEDILDIPASVSVVERQAIEQRTVLSTIDHLAPLPGAEVIAGGLQTRRYATRGSNIAARNNVREMTDFRYTVLPGIGFNADYLISTTAEDIERLELVRGPASVLYGPNSSRGALNRITRSPLDDQGTDISLTAGQRSTFQGSMRHAAALSDRVGLKISGEYFRGDDWPQPIANAAAVDRAAAIAGGADPDTLLLGRAIDSDERIRADTRVEWRPGDSANVSFAGGVAQVTTFDPVTFGGVAVAQEKGRSWFLQARAEHRSLKTNAFYSKSDIGDAWFPALGVPANDRSWSAWGQIQHSARLSLQQSFTYGADIGRTVARGTAVGANAGLAAETSIGAFLISETQMSRLVALTAAARFDYNSVIGNSAVSPSIAATYRIQPSHALRTAFSRAFATPEVGLWFRDLPVAQFPGGLPYKIRGTGEFQDHTFRRDCGGLCMRSPFNPDSNGGTTAYLPTDATVQWDAVVAILQGQGIDISGIPAPTAADVGSLLATLDLASGFQPTLAAEVIDLTATARSWTNEFEIGYKGLIGNQWRIGVDVYYQTTRPLTAPLEVMSPNVFFDRASLENYLAQFVPVPQAAALADGITAIPVGTVTSEQATVPTDLQLVQRFGGEISHWGVDLDLTVAVTAELSATTVYSWVSEDSIPDAVLGRDFVFNNPKNRASFAVDYSNLRVGVNAALRGRHVQSFPGDNGSFRGQVDSYTLFDAVFGYRIPRSNITLALTAYNVFNDVHQELPGTGMLGRQLLGGVRASF